MAIVRKYKSYVVRIINPLPDIYRVSFSSKKQFKYLPGQFLHLALDIYDGIGQWPESRCFSMQSSTREDNITITFSVKGEFTKRMAEELLVGKEVWLKLPYGDIFNRGHQKENCIFIAGGTGITPFLSLFTSDEFGSYKNPRLYFGLRDKTYNIFNEELNAAGLRNSDFKIEYVHENESGLINIEEICKNNLNSVYFISGPPQMIKNFKCLLSQSGISSEKIITDDWE